VSYVDLSINSICWYNNRGQIFMIKKEGKLLIVDDDEDVLLAATMVLKRDFMVVQSIKDPNKLVQILRKEAFDAVLLDMNFSEDITSGREGFFWLKNIQALRPETVVVLFTAFGGVEMAVRAIKEGAFDFVLKPWQNEKLLATMHAAIRFKKSKSEVVLLKEKEKEFVALINPKPIDFIGRSEGMLKVFQTISKVASTEANVLITGENGTGKELVAKALHQQSHRSRSPFVGVDMGSLSGNLFESELFGHVKGAFTDARDDRAGRFELASDGSIFLDEIGNLPVSLQPKLLSVLQNRIVTRVGDSKQRKIHARLICATNNDLLNAVANGEFRQDLLYRINTVEIRLPSLRERRDDIPVLVAHFLEIYMKKYGKQILYPSQEMLRLLMDQQWPGNVRELQHIIERAVIMSDGKQLNHADLISSNTQTNVENVSSVNLEELEKRTIEVTLMRYKGNVSQTALELGLSRAALYRRMEKYGI
jgi:two-component system, NtrC family, response regulator HydG